MASLACCKKCPLFLARHIKISFNTKKDVSYPGLYFKVGKSQQVWWRSLYPSWVVCFTERFMKHSLNLSNESHAQSHVIHVEEGPLLRRSVVVSDTGYVSGNLERTCSREIEIEIVGAWVPNKGRGSSASDCSVEVEQDLDRPAPETRLHLGRVARDCRICHLGLHASNPGSGIPMELGCSCKNDLAAAHKHCAEAWFKIKGNKICEICGSIARSVSASNAPDLTQQQNGAGENETVAAVAPAVQVRRFWHGHRFLYILLAIMVLAFVISWLFHFRVPS